MNMGCLVPHEGWKPTLLLIEFKYAILVTRKGERGKEIEEHSPLQKVSADVRFPDLETEGKNVRRMSGFVVDPISSRESDGTTSLKI